MHDARSSLIVFLLAFACHDDTTRLPLDTDSGASGDPGSSSAASPTSSSSDGPDAGSNDADGWETSAGVDSSSGASAGTSTDGTPDSPPDVLADLYRTPMDTALVVDAQNGLFANDVDAETLWLGLADADAVSQRGGTVIVEDDGAFIYTPPAGVWGPDSFGYSALDSEGVAASAAVTINVLPTQVPLSAILPGVGGYPIDGVEGAISGWVVAGAGDVDGDGLADIVTSSPYGNTGTGQLHVVFGKANHDPASLGDVDIGIGGFLIRGAQQNGVAGFSVDGAGDVDGDGLADLVIADPGVVYDSQEPVPFSAYVVFGKVDGAQVDLADVAAGNGGFVITGLGVPADYQAMLFVAGAGDVNSDGLADVVITAPRVPGSEEPRTWVVFGTASTEPLSVDTLAAQGSGFVVEGAGPWYGAGRPHPVDGAGDVNGDGAADIIVGAAGAVTPIHEGRAYVVFGKADSDPVDLAAVEAGVGGFAIGGEAQNDRVGDAVAGVGDVDGDGLADVAIGAYYFGDFIEGRGYVVLGKADTNPVELSDVALGDGGFAILGAAFDQLGMSVGGGGDIDGDGLDDIVVGATPQTPNEPRGRVHVVYGKTDGDAVDLAASMDGSEGYWLDAENNSYATGECVAIAGDVDGDGLADVLASSYSGDDYAGRTYVFSGTSKAPEPEE